MSVYLTMHENWDGKRLAFPDITYGELHQQVLNTVQWLRDQGVNRGDIVCVQLPKSHRLLLLLLAGLAMGAPVLPLNDRYTAAEVMYYVEDVEAVLSVLMVELPDWPGVVIQEHELPTSFPISADVHLPDDLDET